MPIDAINERLNELFLAGRQDDPQFWELMSLFVKRRLRRYVPIDEIDDVSQDALMSVLSSIDKVKVTGDPAVFTRWASGVIKNHVADWYRGWKANKEMPISQLGQPTDEHFEVSLESLGAVTNPVEPLDEGEIALCDAVAEIEELRVKAVLDRFRENLTAKSRAVFDALREGKTRAEIGLTDSDYVAYLNRWRHLAKDLEAGKLPRRLRHQREKVAA
jgi:DNA-directed RNA polymerase specialized sigma24 family protein